MERLTFIELDNWDRSVLYWDQDVQEANIVKVRTVSDVEFNKVVNMETSRIKEFIDDVLNENCLKLDI